MRNKASHFPGRISYQESQKQNRNSLQNVLMARLRIVHRSVCLAPIPIIQTSNDGGGKCHG